MVLDQKKQLCVVGMVFAIMNFISARVKCPTER